MMARELCFKFLDRDLNRAFIALLKRAHFDHRVEKDGLVRFSAGEEERIENEVISAVRQTVFPSWQVVSCPQDWAESYRTYMTRHRIPFVEELSNNEISFLVSRRYRPHTWKIDDPGSGKSLRVAV